MTYQVVALMESIRKCWGQGSFQETPRLARWLFNVAYALVSANVTFVQAQHLVNPASSPERAAITARITNPRIRAEWEWLEAMKLDRREERIESTLNRIKPFVEHEAIRPMLGQYTKTLDFPGILSENKILLVNPSGDPHRSGRRIPPPQSRSAEYGSDIERQGSQVSRKRILRHAGMPEGWKESDPRTLPDRSAARRDRVAP